MEEVWFNSLDVRKAYSQLHLCDNTSKQSNLLLCEEKPLDFTAS